jgi:hypothetical protein
MPSRFSSLYQRFALPVLETHLGEAAGDILRYPLGKLEGRKAVDGIFVEESAADDQSRGHENVRKAVLVLFDTTIAADTRDYYLVKGETWITRAIQRGTDPTITLDLERRDMEVRHGEGGKNLL